MPTPKHQQDLLQRLNESLRHGTLEIRKALSSNSLQKSPTITDGKDGKKNADGNPNGKKGKKNNSGKSGRNGASDNSGDTANKTSEDTKTDRKTKRKLEMATTCSLHGLNAGHNDIMCFDDHESEENKKKVDANRADPKMKNYFRDLDHASKKRARPSTN